MFVGALRLRYSDGGGVQDEIRKAQVQKDIDQSIQAKYPELDYHPIALPENRGKLNLDTNTETLLESNFTLLNHSSPLLS